MKGGSFYSCSWIKTEFIRGSDKLPVLSAASSAGEPLITTLLFYIRILLTSSSAASPISSPISSSLIVVTTSAISSSLVVVTTSATAPVTASPSVIPLWLPSNVNLAGVWRLKSLTGFLKLLDHTYNCLK